MKKRYIILIALGAALAARQLNTVPDAELSGRGVRIVKVENLFGSTYQGRSFRGTMESKDFNQILRTLLPD
jgi:hypothetical protein